MERREDRIHARRHASGTRKPSRRQRRAARKKAFTRNVLMLSICFGASMSAFALVTLATRTL